jgi:hypothetical protein
MTMITVAQAEAMRLDVMEMLDHIQADAFHRKFPDAESYADFMDYMIVPDDYVPDAVYHVPSPSSIPDDEYSTYMAVMADLRP